MLVYNWEISLTFAPLPDNTIKIRYKCNFNQEHYLCSLFLMSSLKKLRLQHGMQYTSSWRLIIIVCNFKQGAGPSNISKNTEHKSSFVYAKKKVLNT